MIIATPQGEVELLSPEAHRLRNLRSCLPLGAVAFSEPADGARYGIVMKCGENEAWVVKQQPPDIPSESALDVFLANSILIALSIAQYRSFGFGGCLMTSPYIRGKGDESEVGIAYLGAPSRSGIEVAEFPFEGSFDNQFGHGFTTMFTHFVKTLQKSSRDSGITMQPCIGLDHRPRTALGRLGFGFLVHGRDVYCLKTKVSEQDPVWTALRSTGIDQVYHLPSVPTEITPEQLAIAKPGPEDSNPGGKDG